MPATVPDVPGRRAHGYKRNGTTSPAAALDVATGFAVGERYKRHRAKEFLDFLKEIDARVPEDPDIRVVMDNQAAYKTAAAEKWPGPVSTNVEHR